MLPIPDYKLTYNNYALRINKIPKLLSFDKSYRQESKKRCAVIDFIQSPGWKIIHTTKVWREKTLLWIATRLIFQPRGCRHMYISSTDVQRTLLRHFLSLSHVVLLVSVRNADMITSYQTLYQADICWATRALSAGNCTRLRKLLLHSVKMAAFNVMLYLASVLVVYVRAQCKYEYMYIHVPRQQFIIRHHGRTWLLCFNDFAAVSSITVGVCTLSQIVSTRKYTWLLPRIVQ